MRRVSFTTDIMVWNNEMEVDHGGHWVRHPVDVAFRSVGRL